jgi:Flp pilus assembly CpaF family ATPase
MKLTGPRKKRLTLKQLIASLVIDPETGAVIWAAIEPRCNG